MDGLKMTNNAFEAREIERALDENGIYSSTTRGPSMRPLFRTHRDIVFIKKPDSTIKRSDVVLYRGAQKYIMHRVIKVKGEKLIIRGDNTFVNEIVGKDEIIGVLSEFIRKGKHITVESKGYRLYSGFWLFIYPIRFILNKLRTLIGRIYRAVYKRGGDSDAE